MPATTQRRVRKRRKVRRTPLLHNLPPHIQETYCQEMLDQACMFRQLTAASNGIPGPIDRNIIPNYDLEEEMNASESESQEPTPTPSPEPAPEPTPEPTPEPPPDDKSDTPSNNISLEDIKALLTADRKSLFKKVLVGGPIALLAAVLLFFGTLGALKWLQPGDDAAATVVPGGQTTVVETDEQLLHILGQSGYSMHSTDLSETADHVYNYDPALRDRHLRELQETFDRDP